VSVSHNRLSTLTSCLDLDVDEETHFSAKENSL
jgi:hypothetical protein